MTSGIRENTRRILLSQGKKQSPAPAWIPEEIWPRQIHALDRESHAGIRKLMEKQDVPAHWNRRWLASSIQIGI